uniref:Putative 8.9kda 1 8.9 kDa family salivary gland overexpressed n=1 Tax=Rhipicephalus microplus TaxID=6941 RepID=A0A6M2D8B9_RHIMP
MRNIAYCLILKSVFVLMIECALVNKKNNETPRRNWYIAVPVLNHNGVCKYHNEVIEAHSAKSFFEPCQFIWCAPNATEVLIKGCPAAESTPSSSDKKSWPNCCPQWQLK